jgi:antitoxin component HigA of HigAB toxin-antitoxin module
MNEQELRNQQAEIANVCIVNALRLPDKLKSNIAEKILQHVCYSDKFKKRILQRMLITTLADPESYRKFKEELNNPTPMTRPELIQFMQAHPLITASRLAEAVGVSRQMMSQILACKKNLTPELGRKCGEVLRGYGWSAPIPRSKIWDLVDKANPHLRFDTTQTDGGNLLKAKTPIKLSDDAC